MAKKINVAEKERNIIIIRDVNKITKAYLEPCKDPNTNMYSDAVRLTDDKNNMILSEDDKKSAGFLISVNDVIEIYDGKEFDLNSPKDSAWWDAIKYSPFIAQEGRWQTDASGKLIIDGDSKRYGIASYYVEVPGVEASKNVSKKFRVHDAVTKIKESSYDEMLEKTRLLGNWMKNASISDIQDYLIRTAEENPDRIDEVYDSQNASYEILFLEAVDKRVIRQDKGFFIYGTTQLGSTRESVISTLKNDKNEPIRKAISKELYG